MRNIRPVYFTLKYTFALYIQMCVSIVLQIQRYENLDLKPSNQERIKFMIRCKYKAIVIVRAYGI